MSARTLGVRREGSRVTALLGLAVVSIGLLLAGSVPAAGAGPERLSCDVQPIIFGHGPRDGKDYVWAYDLASEAILWEHELKTEGAGDIGQDPFGRLYLSLGGTSSCSAREGRPRTTTTPAPAP